MGAGMVHGVDGATAVRQVNDTLQGPVIDILRQLVPELKKLPRAEALERTLDDIGLLERCFMAFRGHRDRFTPVLIDQNRAPVADDTSALRCGRTLDEVVAMVVRTAAKRYFRRRFSPDAPQNPVAARLRRDVRDQGFVHRIKSLFVAPPAKVKARHVRADELYQAIREFLRHDWQVPMVPTYAGMTPTLIRSLGAKILDVRELAQLKRIVDDPAEAAKLFDLPDSVAGPAADAPVAEAAARDERARLSVILSPDGKRLNADQFEGLLLRPLVRKYLPAPTQTLKNMEILRGVGGVPVKLLVAELGLKMEQLTVMLLVAQDILGPDSFCRMFGRPGDAATVMRLTQRARQAGIGQHSDLSECAVFVRQLFASFATTRAMN